MKKIAAIFLAFASTSAFADKITLRADDWCPYNCEPGSAKPGYMVEIAEKVFKEAGHTIEYKYMSWNRALKEVEEGKFAGAIGTSPSESEGFVFPKSEQGMMNSQFFVKADSTWKFTDIKSLDTAILGSIKDYEYGGGVDEYIEKNAKNNKKVQQLAGDDATTKNIKKLESGRITTFVEDGNVFFNNIESLGLKGKFKSAGEVKVDDPSENYIYIGFSPKNPKSKEYAKILSDGMDKMRASGELKKILAKYGLEDWKK